MLILEEIQDDLQPLLRRLPDIFAEPEASRRDVKQTQRQTMVRTIPVSEHPRQSRFLVHDVQIFNDVLVDARGQLCSDCLGVHAWCADVCWWVQSTVQELAAAVRNDMFRI